MSTSCTAAHSGKRISLILGSAFALQMLFSSAALAGNISNQTPMGYVICTIVFWFLFGDIGRGLSTLAVIVLGVGATLGKVSWGLAVTVAIGIAVMFGAPTIVGLMTNNASFFQAC